MERKELIEKIEGYFGTLEGIENLSTDALNKIINIITNKKQDEQIMNEINKGSIVTAIKLCKELMHYDLKKARDYVYFLMRR